MRKILLSAAMTFSLAFGASAQAKKTTVKTKTTTEAAPVPALVHATTTAQPRPATIGGGTEERTSSSDGFHTRPQSNDNGGDIKAGGGEVTLEANVNILGNSVTVSNSSNEVRVPYFLADGLAARLG